MWSLRCLFRTSAGNQLSRRSYAYGTARTHSSRAREILPQVASLSDTRGVIRIAGDELVGFLQGLLTNDVKQLYSKQSPVQYTAMLNAHGRFLHDMFLYRQPGETPTILADVDKTGLESLLKLLKRYKLRAKVDVADVSSEYTVWARFGPGQFAEGDWIPDPRLEALGQRMLLPARDKATSPSGEPETEGVEFRAWRIEHGIAEGDSEITSGQAIPLEYNLDKLNAISFTKGCYVGQELIARSHFQGLIRKRLMPVQIDTDEDIKIGEPIFAPSMRKRPVGTLQALHNGRGLACLNLHAALPAIDDKQQLYLGETKMQVMLWRPDWWPQDWGREDFAT